jgi:hypothetical protein
VAAVRIQGVPFELEDAAEFAKRLQRASAGASQAGLSPAHPIAIEIDQAVTARTGDVEVREEAREIVFGVLDGWYGTSPASARQLRRLIGQ